MLSNKPGRLFVSEFIEPPRISRTLKQKPEPIPSYPANVPMKVKFTKHTFIGGKPNSRNIHIKYPPPHFTPQIVY